MWVDMDIPYRKWSIRASQILGPKMRHCELNWCWEPLDRGSQFCSTVSFYWQENKRKNAV